MSQAFFSVAYKTNFGEEVFVGGSLKELGDWNAEQAVKLDPNQDFSIWTKMIQLPKNRDFEFKFVVKNSNTGLVKWEEQENRTFPAKAYSSPPFKFPTFDSMYFRAFWQPALSPQESVQQGTSAFKDVIFRRVPDEPNVPKPSDFILEFRTKVFRIKPGSYVVVYGNLPQLGNGNPLKGVRMTPISTESAVWTSFVSVPASSFSKGFHFTYNYAIVDQDKRVTQEISSRSFEPLSDIPKPNGAQPISFIRLADPPFMYGSRSEWKGAGVALPMFSFRSENSLGIGEFLDIKPMADWLSLCGIRLLQILPINDTRTKDLGSWDDSSPYKPVSSYALHPVYMNVESLDLSDKLKDLINLKKDELNSLPFADYPKVLDLKMAIMKEVFLTNQATIVASEGFQEFINREDNKYWLPPYALFLFFQSLYKTVDFNKWPEEHRNPSREDIDRMCEEHREFLLETFWIQYNLHLQLSEAVEYASKKRVVVKGDLPIGVARTSVDAWSNPHLFRLNYGAGAPPDFFTSDGQNWGFPTYDWKAMKKENYLWWRMRLHLMAKYFQAYRIDHILGFFRIWEIPTTHIQGLLGRFQPSNPLRREELEKRGLWDFQRYCEPFIRQRHIDQLPKILVKKFFEKAEDSDIWRFKECYRTERAIEKELRTGAGAGEFISNISDDYREQLFSLLRNVVLVQDPEEPDWFYPRIECMSTDSYQSLEDYAKKELYELHNDYYYVRQDEFWTKEGLDKLSMMESASEMMVCGEDLGMVPACVPGVLARLNILCLRLERMAISPELNCSPVNSFPYMCVCTPSVHDMSNLRAWWEENGSVRQMYYNNILGEQGEAPVYCEPWIMKKIIENHLYGPSMWCVLTIQDIFGMFPEFRVADPKTETINVPGAINHQWKYRMHVPIEKLIQSEEVTKTLQEMLEQSQRSFDY